MDSYSQMNGQSDGGGTQHVYDSLTQQFYPISTQSLADAPQPETNNLSWYESLDSAYLTGNDLYAADSSFAQQQARGSQQVQEVSYSQPAFLQPQVPQALNIDPAAAAAIYKAQVPIGPKRTSASEARSGRISLPEHKIRLPKEGPESLAPAIDLSHRRSQSFTALPTPDDNDFTRATGMAPALTRTLTKPTPMGPPIAPSLLSRRADAFNKKAAARKSIDSAPASPSSPTGSGRMKEDPAYDYYGSSFVGFNAPTSGRAMPDPSTFVPLAEKSPTPEPFDPVALGLPQPPNPVPGQAQNRKGLYSSSGFDMLGVLARVVQRSNPEIELGPIDAACSFVIVDARKFDQPIVYASENFSRLTGYSNAEILGQNCRFLQSPDALVPAGSKRKYTDSHACFHMKKHIMTGRETQASLINYCKGGRPFINLVTIIPITWDSSEIAYYVGFQVDLVDQPTAILEKMKNGTYIVNYSVLGQSMPKTVSADRTYSIEAPSSYDMEQSRSRADSIVGLDATPSAETPVHVDSATTASNPSKLIDSVVNGATLTSASSKKWQKLVLEHCDDFMHVLSIKGTFLYVSPSTARLLEYEVDELIGKTLASICHPSDVVAVLRELKEAGSVNRPKVSLLYRVQRKRSGYQWMECQGKMHVESGKNRKSVVLVGRPREVYKMSWKDLDLAGGLVEREFWSKMTMDGQLLYTTPNVKKIIGMTSSELLGSRFSKLLPEEEEAAKHAEILTAIGQSSRGQLSNVRHKIRGRSGVIDVSTNFYPSESTDEIEALDPLAPPASPPRQYTAIVQTSVCSDNAAARPKAPLPSQSQRSKAPGSSRSFSSTGSDSPTPSSLFSGNGSSSSSGYHSPASSWSLQSIPRKLADGEASDAQSSNSSGSSFSAIPSTYKTLQDPVNRRDNVFDELVTTRGTSWQFELHQLKLTNRRLREEKEALAALQQRKRRHINMLDTPPVPGAPRSCANCGRTGSPEWRMGPTGPKTLCNACGLRWSKAKSTGASTPSETATTPRPAASAGAPSPLGLTSVASPRIQRPAFFSIPSELTKSFEQSNLGS